MLLVQFSPSGCIQKFLAQIAHRASNMEFQWKFESSVDYQIWPEISMDNCSQFASSLTVCKLAGMTGLFDVAPVWQLSDGQGKRNPDVKILTQPYVQVCRQGMGGTALSCTFSPCWPLLGLVMVCAPLPQLGRLLVKNAKIFLRWLICLEKRTSS